MVSQNVDPVAVAKIGVESVSYSNLHSFGEAKIVVTRQAAYELPPRLPRTRLHPPIAPMLEEDASKPAVLVHPVTISILLVLLLRRLGCACRPLAPAIKQVAEEEDRVGIQLGLYAGVGAAHVLVGVLHGERVERPWAARVRVRVDELRVGDEDESVRIGSFLLRRMVSRSMSCTRQCHEAPYPVLPCVPAATPYCAVEGAPFAPVHHRPPDHNQHIG